MGKCTLTLVVKANESYILEVEATKAEEAKKEAEDAMEEKREKPSKLEVLRLRNQEQIPVDEIEVRSSTVIAPEKRLDAPPRTTETTTNLRCCGGAYGCVEAPTKVSSMTLTLWSPGRGYQNRVVNNQNGCSDDDILGFKNPNNMNF